jgi:prepilin-type N-terminal cleavage/methylation domain-containing protein
MSRSLRSRRRSGFNLVELLFAMALFVIGFLGVLALFTTGFGAVSHTKNVTYATHIAQSQIEKIRFSDFANIQSVPRTTVKGGAVVNGQPVTTTFYRTLTVTPNVDNTLKTVVIQVIWQERGFNGVDEKKWQSLAMETVLGQQQ